MLKLWWASIVKTFESKDTGNDFLRTLKDQEVKERTDSFIGSHKDSKQQNIQFPRWREKLQNGRKTCKLTRN